MTIGSLTNRNDYTGNGSLNTYSYTFKIFNEEHLEVTVADLLGVETTLALATDYTVTGVGETAGGTIVLVSAGQAWLTGANLTTGYALTIKRILPLLQETDIRNQGDFFPEVHENQFDRDIMIAQQLQAQLDSQISLPETETPTAATTTLPSITARTNKFFKWDGSGDIAVSSIDFDDLASGNIFVGNASGEPASVPMTGDVTISNTGVTDISSLAFSKLAPLTSGNILVGNASNVVTSVAMTGDITISNTGVTAITAGSIVNADINATAAIDFSKLALLTSGNLIIGNASNVPTSTAVTGDVLINNLGVTAINANVIVDGDINASAAITLTKLAALNSLNLPKTDASGYLISSPWGFDAAGNVTTGQQDQLRFLDGGGTGYVGIFAANTTTTYTLQLPPAQGAADQYLVNNGTGILTWTSITGGPGGTVNAGLQYQIVHYPANGNTVDGLPSFTTNVNGDLFLTRSAVATNTTMQIYNSDATSVSSHSVLTLLTNSATGGDPFIQWAVNGVGGWVMGVDNSDGDKWKLSKSGSLGTNDYITTDGIGAIVVPQLGGFAVEHSSAGNLSVIYAVHNDNTAGNSDAVFIARSGGSTGGDAYLRTEITGGGSWIAGIANNASDNWCLSATTSDLLINMVMAASYTSATQRAVAIGNVDHSDFGLNPTNVLILRGTNTSGTSIFMQNDHNPSSVANMFFISRTDGGGNRLFSIEAQGVPIIQGQSDNGVANTRWNLNVHNGSSLTTAMNVTDTGLVRHVNGDATNPSISFQNATGSGMSWSSAGATSLQFSHLGSLRLAYDTTNGWNLPVGEPGFKTSTGSVSVPSLSFAVDPDTGFYRIASGQVGLALDGNLDFQVQPRATLAGTEMILSAYASALGIRQLNYGAADSGGSGFRLLRIPN